MVTVLSEVSSLPRTDPFHTTCCSLEVIPRQAAYLTGDSCELIWSKKDDCAKKTS
jgi:hypothetical protein